MITKYDTGDEVLIPVKIANALTRSGEVLYTIRDLTFGDMNFVVPEGVIEGKATIGYDKYNKMMWEKREKTLQRTIKKAPSGVLFDCGNSVASGRRFYILT